jgi:hypothetical protein
MGYLSSSLPSPGIKEYYSSATQGHNTGNGESDLATHFTTWQYIDALQKPHNANQDGQDADYRFYHFHT